MKRILAKHFIKYAGFLMVVLFCVSSFFFYTPAIKAFFIGGSLWLVGVIIKGFLWHFADSSVRFKKKPLEGILCGIIGAISELGVVLIYFLLDKSVLNDFNYLWSFGLGAGFFELILIIGESLGYDKKYRPPDKIKFFDGIVAPFERFYAIFLHWSARFLLAKAVSESSFLFFLISFASFSFADGFAQYAVKKWDLNKRANLIKLQIIMFLNAVIIFAIALGVK
jgi:hypothetical protein